MGFDYNHTERRATERTSDVPRERLRVRDEPHTHSPYIREAKLLSSLSSLSYLNCNLLINDNRCKKRASERAREIEKDEGR
jgi:hypothetical protein